MNARYWIAMLIGALAVLIAYKWASRSAEAFACREENNKTYIETHANSLLDGLYVYLTSFSDLVAGTTDAPVNVFEQSSQKWRDLFKGTAGEFSLISTNPLSNICDAGVPLKNVLLTGQPSEWFSKNPEQKDYTLESFTVAYYARMNSLNFGDAAQPMVLWRMIAETPHRVELRIRPAATNTVYVEAVLGDISKVYRWEIPKTTLLSNGNPTLFTFSYDAGTGGLTNRKAYFYLGLNKYEANLVDNVDPIRLSNGEVKINPNLNFDANLLAFAYFKKVLTDENIIAWTTYFLQELGGATAALRVAQESATAQIQSLTTQIDEQAGTADELKAELEKCKANVATVEKQKDTMGWLKWQIAQKTEFSDVDISELKKCPALHLGTASNKTTETASSVTGSRTIAYPNPSINEAKSLKPTDAAAAAATTTASTTTATTATTTTAATTAATAAATTATTAATNGYSLDELRALIDKENTKREDAILGKTSAASAISDWWEKLKSITENTF